MTAKKKIAADRLKEKIDKWDKAKATPIKVPPRKLNEALAETALNRIGYHQGSIPIRIDSAVQMVADSVLSEMPCPLIQNGDWDCNKVREGEELGHPVFSKGCETQCKKGGFVNCPAYHRYFNWRMKYQAGKRGKGESTE